MLIASANETTISPAVRHFCGHIISQDLKLINFRQPLLNFVCSLLLLCVVCCLRIYLKTYSLNLLFYRVSHGYCYNFDLEYFPYILTEHNILLTT